MANIYTGSGGIGNWWTSSDPTTELGQEGDPGWYYTDAGKSEAVRQYNAAQKKERDRQYGLAVKRLQQEAAQIAIQKGQAEANAWYNRQMVKLSQQRLAEDARQFNVTSSGYLDNGNPTLEREKFQDNSLYNWTKEAIDLASQPEDWVKYRRYTSGVAANAGAIPGLAWTQGGQQGNQTFQGQQKSNSLSNVLTAMGIATGDSTGTQQTAAPATTAGTTDANWAQQAVNQSAGDATGANSAVTTSNQIASTANDEANMTGDERQLYETANAFSQNPSQSAPGWWHSLDPTTQKLIAGAAKAQGHDWASVMSRLGRSTWGWAA